MWMEWDRSRNAWHFDGRSDMVEDDPMEEERRASGSSIIRIVVLLLDGF